MSVKAIAWAFDQQINDPLAKLTLVAIADSYNDDTGACFPSNRLLTHKTSQHTRTVQRKIAKLQHLGFITKMPTLTARGRQTSNTYEFNWGDWKPFKRNR